MKELTVVSLVLARMKRLKNGRVIHRSYYNFPCRAPLLSGDDGKLVAVIDNRFARVVLKGTLQEDSTFTVLDEDILISELRHPYLKKGFKTPLGYSLSARLTTTGAKNEQR